MGSAGEAPCTSSCRDFPTPPLLSGRGSIAPRRAVSTGAQPQELALAGLHDRAVARLDVVARDRLAVEPDAALVDRAPPVARRVAEVVREELRQVHGPAVYPRIGNLLVRRRLVAAYDAREVALAGPRAVVAVPAAGHTTRE